MRTMHLFAGAGGGLLADLILGHQPVCAVEWDAYATGSLNSALVEFGDGFRVITSRYAVRKLP